MKQLLQNLRSGETRVVEVPIPTPQPGELLVQTAASLVSAGTERTLVTFAEKSLLGKARSRPDLMRQLIDKARREGLAGTVEAAFNRLDQPMPLGYSSAGTVVAVGVGVVDVRVGQRVACAGGNYAVHAEYAAVPRNLVTPFPDTLDFEQAAFTTLGAIALHGFRLSQVQLGSSVAVIGLGLLGLLSVEIALAAGCRVLGIDLDQRRVSLAQTLGAHAGMRAQAVLRPEAVGAVQAFTRGRGADAVLICADTKSDDPVELAGEIARDRAQVVAVGAVGLSLPRKIYYEKELSFINSRSYGPGRYDPLYEESGIDYPIGYVRWSEGRNLEAFVELLAEERVDVRPLISHRFPILQAAEAYELITGKRGEPFLGVLLTYPEPAAAPGVGAPAVQAQPGETLSPLGSGPRTPLSICRLGVLGAGSFANAVLLPAVKKAAESLPLELELVVSASGASAQHAARRFGFRRAASDEHLLLADPQVNTVAVLTRHHLHARQVLAALRAGKNVFCEKPLAIEEEELDEIAQLLLGEGSAGLPLLTVGFNRRFAPLAQQLKAFLSGLDEPLAATYRVNAGYIPLNHWLHDPAQGGGRIIGEGCHFIDFLTFLVGEAPHAVSAVGLPDGGRYREDNLQLTFHFPDGSLGTVIYLANGDKSFPKERLEVFGAGRAACLDDFRSLELVKDGRRQIVRSRLRQDKGHRAEWLAFVEAVVRGGPAPIPYEQILGVTRASLRAVEALRARQELAI